MANGNEYANKVMLADGRTLIDLTGDDVTAADVLEGVKFHLPSGAPATGGIDTVNGRTVVPARSEQTAVAAGKYTLGAVKVAAIPGNYYTLPEVYPVGSYYATENSENPAAALGFGTWSSVSTEGGIRVWRRTA